MKKLNPILFLYNAISVVKLLTLIILSFIVLILDYHQYDSLLFIILIILIITDILLLFYFYLKIKHGELEKKQFKKNSKNTILFWISMLIIWSIFLATSDGSKNSLHFMNLYVCFSYLYSGFVSQFIIYNNKGILKTGLFLKFILFNKIQNVQYLNDTIIIKTKNRVIKYSEFKDRNKELKIILEEHTKSGIIT
jgi:hypothetical protein